MSGFGGVAAPQPSSPPDSSLSTPGSLPWDFMGPSLFTFSGYLNATLPGNSKVCPEPFDNAAIAAEDAFEGVAVVLLRAGSTSSCWPSPNYADSNYPLTVGWLTSESVVIDGVSSNATYKAYQFDAPQEASQYRASEHALFFWPSMGNVSYTVWSYHNGIMLPLAHIQEEVIEVRRRQRR